MVDRELLNISLSLWAIKIAVPSMLLSRMLPLKPSHTTTSTLPVGTSLCFHVANEVQLALVSGLFEQRIGFLLEFPALGFLGAVVQQAHRGLEIPRYRSA